MLLAGMTCFLGTRESQAQQVPVQEHQLDNGMRVLILRRTGEPTVSGGWVARVGSSNERPGITGIAHLFEHMMFKGTPTLGTRDYKKDLEIIDAQEQVREAMRAEEAKMRAAYRRGEIDDLQKPENKTERYRELEKEFQKLIEAQREILVKNEFDKVYTTAGASGMNAFTTHDLTGYFITVPSNRLEFWMWMESERLLRPVFREFYAERDVVFEERRMRTESTPLGKHDEQFNALFWVSHPYHWPVIGWPSDIDAISKAQADEFYARYYAPSNITLVLVGDLDPKQAVPMIERYFGRIPGKNQPAPDVVTLELDQVGEKRFAAEAEVNPQVDILWHTVPFQHPDSYALEVVAQILSERTGRLYKGLVLGSKVATSAFARQDSRKWAGLFNIGGEAADGHTPEEVEKAIEAELEKLRNEPVPDRELQKVKNNFAAYEYRKLSQNFHIMLQLIFYEGLGNWKEINQAGPRIQKVTAEEIQRVVKQYFTPERKAVAVYTRKAGSDSEGDPMAGLSEQQKSVLRLIEGKLAESQDVGALRQQAEAVRQRMAEAQGPDQTFMKLYLERIEARLQALEAQ